MAVNKQAAFCAGMRNKVVDSVDASQKSAFAAAARADYGRYTAGKDIHSYIFYADCRAVIETEILGFYYGIAIRFYLFGCSICFVRQTYDGFNLPVFWVCCCRHIIFSFLHYH
jgi:hypothetical protein